MISPPPPESCLPERRFSNRLFLGGVPAVKPVWKPALRRRGSRAKFARPWSGRSHTARNCDDCANGTVKKMGSKKIRLTTERFRMFSASFF
jgi:hypothetical protein